MSNVNLNDELQRIDMQLTELEDLRTSIVHKMVAQIPTDIGSSNLLPFPNPTAITGRPSLSYEWPIGALPPELP